MLYASAAQGYDAQSLLVAALQEVHDQAEADGCEVVQVSHDTTVVTELRRERDAKSWGSVMVEDKPLLITVTAVGALAEDYPHDGQETYR